MTGRSLHDALLAALSDARVRRDPSAARLGAQEAAVLTRADRGRLERLSRFMARHFYRERLVRLFRHSCALARRHHLDPLPQVDEPDFLRLMEGAVLGSPETAEAVAHRFERWFLEAIERAGGPAWWKELVRYEATLFRAEAGRGAGSGLAPPAASEAPRAPRRASSARIASFDFDIPALLTRLENLSASDPLPWALKKAPTRLLVAVSSQGVLRVVRCSDALEGFWKCLDGTSGVEEIARTCGLERGAVESAVKALADIGAVEI